VIVLTRLNGERFALSIDQIERVEERPDTVVTTSEGNTYTVRESLNDVVDLVRAAKAAVFGELEQGGWRTNPGLHLVSSDHEQSSG